MKNLYLIGGGGHCHSCIDVIELENKFSIEGIFDKKENVGNEVMKYPIIGDDEDLEKYINKENYFLITVGQIKSPEIRIKLFSRLMALNAQLATIISPRAYISKHAKIQKGCIVLHNAIINANVIIGENCIINTKSLIEHDSIVGNNCHISTAAIINGNCKLGDGIFVGSNSVLKEGIVVANKAIIPAGSFYSGR